MSEALSEMLQRKRQKGFYDGYEGKPKPLEPDRNATWAEKEYYAGWREGRRERERRDAEDV